jgi:hypothetical protein
VKQTASGESAVVHTSFGEGKSMELDVKVCGKSLAIPIENPFQLDIEATAGRIESFLASQGTILQGLDFRGLLPKMIKGVAGCEGGCPADAQRLVARGFANFKFEYIEGGILHAEAATKDGKQVALKMFPDF